MNTFGTLSQFLLLVSCLNFRQQGCCNAQVLYQVHAEQIPPVRVGTTARLRCSFVGDNITMQYVSWTKLDHTGRRNFVYEYSEHPPLARAYNDFIGRAAISNADMNDNRYSHLKRPRRRGAATGSEKMTLNDNSRGEYHPDTSDEASARLSRTNDPPQGVTERAITGKPNSALYDWANIQESIYGLFLGSSKTGKRPDFWKIDDIFKSIKDKAGMADRLKRLSGKVTREDIQRIVSPRNYDPLPVPVRLTAQPQGRVHHMEESDRRPSAAHAHSGSSGRLSQYPGQYGRSSRRKRDLPIHHIDLALSHVLLTDETTYECLVKPVNGPAMSSTMRLVVHVPPSTPVLDDFGSTNAEGGNLTLACTANVGKPPGTITWVRRRLEDPTFHELPDRVLKTHLIALPNGTTTAVSKLMLQLDNHDDGATYRCTATSDIMGAYEPRPFAQKTLNVQYPPRGGRILFDTAVGRYYCHARGKPAPTYSWVWIRPDGRQSVMSSNRYLDLTGMRRSGYYRFHCLASNIIHGIRHTKVMATKLRVIAPESEKTPTTQNIPVKSPLTRGPPAVPVSITHRTTSASTSTMKPLAATAPPFGNKQDTPEGASRQLIPTFDITGRHPQHEITRRKPVAAEKQKSDDYYYYYYYDNEQDRAGSDRQHGQPEEKTQQDMNRYRGINPDEIAMERSPEPHNNHFVEAPPMRTLPTTVSTTTTEATTTTTTEVPTIPQHDTNLFPIERQKDAKTLYYEWMLNGNMPDTYREEIIPIHHPTAAPTIEDTRPAGRENRNKDSTETVSMETTDSPPRWENGEWEPVDKVSQPPYDDDLDQTGQVLSIPHGEAAQPTELSPTEGLQTYGRRQYSRNINRYDMEEVEDIGNEEEEEGEMEEDMEEEDGDEEEEEMEEEMKEHQQQEEEETGEHEYDETDYQEEEEQKARRTRKRKIKRKPKKRKYKSRKEVEYRDAALSNKYEEVTRTTSEEFDCRRRRSAVYGAGCRAFYRCVRGKTYFVECVSPYVYNKKTQKCGEPKGAPAPCGIVRDCSDKLSRKYVDADRGCNYYYTCYRGYFMGHNECNPGLVFNEQGQLCDWPQNVKDQCGRRKGRHYRRSGRFAG